MQSNFNYSNTEYHGNNGIITVDPGTVKEDITALATCQATYKIKAARYLSLPGLYAAHPIFTTLVIEKRQLSLKGPWAIAVCDYVGVLTTTYSDIQPTYELTIGTSESPIATHPEFKTFAGTAQRPLNGSIWEYQSPKELQGVRVLSGGKGLSNPNSVKDSSQLTFVGFQAFSSEVGNFLDTLNTPWAGTTSFLDPYMTWKVTQVVPTQPSSLTDVATIPTDPDGPQPQLPSGRNWLYMGMSQTRRGQVWQTVKEWRSSGKNGWNPRLYDH